MPDGLTARLDQLPLSSGSLPIFTMPYADYVGHTLPGCRVTYGWCWEHMCRANSQRPVPNA